nr:MAG TPA: hypothetical protein [Caudoviricetes sp.]
MEEAGFLKGEPAFFVSRYTIRGAHVPAAKPPELCGHLPRRRAARHAVRPRPSCMCNIPS